MDYSYILVSLIFRRNSTFFLQNLNGKISGIILTGWQRYSHYSPLCEILPVSIPSLIVDLVYLNSIELSENEIIQKAKLSSLRSIL